MVDVAVIFVNYNTTDLVINSIQSVIDKSIGVSYELIVVDNGSTDFPERILNQFPYVKYIRSMVNKGFGGANNLGVANAEAKYMFFLNPDTLLVNNAIAILKNFLDANEDVGVVGGNLVDLQMSPVHSYAIRFPSILDDVDIAFFRLLSKFIYNGNQMFNNTNNPMEVAFVTGADYMVRRNLFEDVGGFSPIFFMYYEDTELSFRIRRIGQKIYNIPQALIVHLEGRSFSHSYSREKRIMESRRKYFLITHGILYLYFSDFIFLLLNLLGLCISLFMIRKKRFFRYKQRIGILFSLFLKKVL